MNSYWKDILAALVFLVVFTLVVCLGYGGPTYTIEIRVDVLEADVEMLRDVVGNHLCNDETHVTEAQTAEVDRSTWPEPVDAEADE